jgi:hypothetical protein
MFMSMLALTRLPKMVTGQSKIVELITKTGEAHSWASLANVLLDF